MTHEIATFPALGSVPRASLIGSFDGQLAEVSPPARKKGGGRPSRDPRPQHQRKPGVLSLARPSVVDALNSLICIDLHPLRHWCGDKSDPSLLQVSGAPSKTRHEKRSDSARNGSDRATGFREHSNTPAFPAIRSVSGIVRRAQMLRSTRHLGGSSGQWAALRGTCGSGATTRHIPGLEAGFADSTWVCERRVT